MAIPPAQTCWRGQAGADKIEFRPNSILEDPMLDVSKDIHSLTEFKSKTAHFVARLKKRRGALLLTVNGKAELAVMSAATFQHLLDELDRLETLRGIEQGLADVEAGRTRPIEEAFARIRKRLRLDESAP